MKVFLGLILFAPLLSVSSAQAQYGLENFKEVMPGALYRGGGNGEREPMSDSSLEGLCQAGFDSAIYLYGRKPGKALNCGVGQIEYPQLKWDRDEDKILSKIYSNIQSGSGPVYAHCWYGVHASGYIAAIALRQFCGYSGEQALSYWNAHVPKKIRYEKVQKMVLNFVPSGSLNLTPAQQSRYCP